MSSAQNKAIRYIILDSCIFQHFANESLSAQIISTLKDAASKKYGIGLSQYSLMELLDNASTENETKRLSAVKGFKQFKIKQTTLIVAAHLGCLYKQEGLQEKQQPETGDKIIAATSILYNALIFTTNARDFPLPFFKEVARQIYIYKTESNKDAAVVGCFFEPAYDVIAQKYNERIGVK